MDHQNRIDILQYRRRMLSRQRESLLNRVARELELLDPTLTDDKSDPASSYKMAVILRLAQLVGTEEEMLIAATGYERGVVRAVRERMFAAQLWKEGVVVNRRWFGNRQDPGDFFMDLSVACGALAFRQIDQHVLFAGPTLAQMSRPKSESDEQLSEEARLRVKRIYPHTTDPAGYRVGVVLMTAALAKTTEIARLARATGYGQDFVELIAGRMEASDIWRSDEIDCSEWQDPREGTISFYMHVQVALATLRRSKAKTAAGKWVYESLISKKN